MTQTPEILPTTNAAPDTVASNVVDLSALKTMSLNDLVERLVNDLVDFAIHLAIALLVFYVGKFIIRKLYHVTAAILTKREVERSLSTFVLSLIKIVLYFILIVTVVGILGINTSSFIAIFASVGVAIGMALSGTLQNFAGGVLILLLKPYRIGDYIEAQGFSGTVTEIQIFSTIICTPDNKSILIPNGGLSTGSINNWSRQEYRRVQWDISISYGDSFDTASEVIQEILSQEPLIVRANSENSNEPGVKPAVVDEAVPKVETEAQPKRNWFKRLFTHHRNKLRERDERLVAAVENLLRRPVYNPSVEISALADSSVNLVVRAWTRSENYWTVYYNVIKHIYTELPKHGVSFPFPQLDVHLSKNIGCD